MFHFVSHKESSPSTSWSNPGAVFVTADCFASDFVGESPVAKPANSKSGESFVSEKATASVRHGKSGVGSEFSPYCCKTDIHRGKTADGKWFLRLASGWSSESWMTGSSLAKKDSTNGCRNKRADISSLSAKSGESSVSRKGVASVGSISPIVSVGRPANSEGSRIPVSKKVDAAVRINESGDGGSSRVTGVRRPVNWKGSKIPVSKKYITSVCSSEGMGSSSPAIAVVKPISCETSRIPASIGNGSVVQSSGEGYSSPDMMKQPSKPKEYSEYVSGNIGEARAAATVLTHAIVCEAACVSYVTRAAFIACRT
ncbi:hypothetical protein [Anaplasma bovis]|uniref:hypothetical protein n=1 Tax=Anaplasma bovis TaxID=186733 RepID=UPI002FEF7D90